MTNGGKENEKIITRNLVKTSAGNKVSSPSVL